MNTTEPLRSADRSLDWLLENLRERTPNLQHALVLSNDGLKMCFTSDLSVDNADQLAAVAAGIQSLALSTSVEFGNGRGSGQAMVEFGGGILLVVQAGMGAHLAGIADSDADVGMIAHNMNELVEQIGAHLTAAPRNDTVTGGATP